MQLELNIESKSEEELKSEIMQKQIDALSESLTKVRKKLFAEVGALKKLCGELQQANEILKTSIERVDPEKIQWVYGEGESLFQVEAQEVAFGS